MVVIKAYNSAGSGPASQETRVKTLAGELPFAPRLHILTTSASAVHLLWRPSVDSQVSASGQSQSIKVLGYSLYFKVDEHSAAWREISVPVNEQKAEQEYVLDDLQANTFYRLYVTATNTYGQGDPSNMITIKTNKDDKHSVLPGGVFATANGQGLPIVEYDMVSVISITVALVIVVLVIVVACVCVRKAQLDAMRTPIDLSAVTLPRNLDPDKAIYVGTTHRYVDLDKSKPLLQGNYAFDTSSGFPVPYSTMPLKDGEELKSFAAAHKPWDRPLPAPSAATTKRKSGIDAQHHVYDCPQ